MSVYAVSDLHGQYDTFTKGLRTIGFTDSDYLYVIGDAIDRGEDGIKILQYIKDQENMDLIIGNHEFLMLNSVPDDGSPGCDGRDADLWLYFNGGIVTYEAYSSLNKNRKKELIEWLKDRVLIKPIMINGQKICLTHSFYIPEFENRKYRDISYNDVFHIVWDSIYRDDPDSKAVDIYSEYDYTFVTGHVPVQKIFMFYLGDENFNRLAIHKHGNLFCIDGGCALGYNSGISNGAIFLRLDDMTEFTIPMA